MKKTHYSRFFAKGDEINSTLYVAFSAPAGYGHELTADNRLNRILEVGELLPKILASGKEFAAKFFPGDSEPLAKLASLPEMLNEVTLRHDEKLRSRIWGGAKTTLGLMMAHYPEVESWQLASGFPLEKEDGTPLGGKDRKAILHSVSGYASKIAKMVSLTTTFKEVLCPPTPIQSDNEGVETEKTASAEFAPWAGLPVEKSFTYAVKPSKHLYAICL